MSSTNKQPLTAQTCEACLPDAPLVTEQEQIELLAELTDWSIIVEENVKQLSKQYMFGNFVEAQAFSNQVGEIAEQAGHHPAILTEWGKVTVRWWSHKIAGLHKNDFVMAAKTDLIRK